jgi:hypothetical protein
MGMDNTKQGNAADATLLLGEDWFDPLEAVVRGRGRGFIEEILEAELDGALTGAVAALQWLISFPD